MTTSCLAVEALMTIVGVVLFIKETINFKIRND
ncbi:hypothetical protein LSH36_87g00006 [Paralvinella palmiformis]|uniref:Uncharacterized protein n=1 Tax=Paralvinella palmiformis TaxID=53620 RepID=A0AAD9K190_9ANNE|nr:hypothetical protein LSH36_87g00006 [Paralvinella palmiformis]